MPYKIITTTNARADIQEAINWENNRQLGFGERLFEILDKKINDLSVTPAMGSVRYLNVRITFTPIFDYNIHYTIDTTEEKVYILRVLHSARKPIY
ncbi:MAG: type II toxin-antitoxin system RelE/ParE family toxin [Bacteroidetes bacterium]|nr:type II toxin-antitoxin system RelE/ParE family toxin [Bacteroidota bacterium]